MKSLKNVVFISVLFMTIQSYSAEALHCDVGVSYPEAKELKLIEDSIGVKLISETLDKDYDDPNTTKGKNFEITLEEGDLRSVIINTNLLDPNNAQLRIYFYVPKKDKDFLFRIDASSKLQFENTEVNGRHSSEMYCMQDNQTCSGNFSNNLENPNDSLKHRYLNYSISCRPML